jgi:hypothetical protein
MAGGWTASMPGPLRAPRKRVAVYGATRKQAAGRLREAQQRSSQCVPVPDRSWKLGDWLDYWLEHVVAPNRRPATYALYEMTAKGPFHDRKGPLTWGQCTDAWRARPELLAASADHLIRRIGQSSSAVYLWPLPWPLFHSRRRASALVCRIGSSVGSSRTPSLLA